jgi:hypothetical protein
LVGDRSFLNFRNLLHDGLEPPDFRGSTGVIFFASKVHFCPDSPLERKSSLSAH